MRRCGFTLIEIMLVVAIMGIVTAVVLPSFARSIRGNRLRVGSRTVVSAGKYCRSMAVMRQKPYALQFDIVAAETKPMVLAVKVLPLDAIEPEPEVSEFMGDTMVPVAAPVDPVSGADVTPGADQSGPASAGGRVEGTLEREVEMVRIAAVTFGDDRLEEGSCQVIYEQNGRCQPYSVEIMDEHGDAVRVSVDALSTATTERLR